MTIARMAALGSSFAAGPGIAPAVDGPAMRSALNYPHLVADALGATLVDATVSGATTDTILHTSQRRGLRRFPPQLELVDPALDLDLVTITAGGNDLGHLGSMLRAGLAARLARHRVTRPLARRMRSRAEPVAPAQVDAATRGLVRIVEEVALRAPRARILLVDYLTIIGPDTRGSRSAPFTPDELDRFRDTAAHLAQAFRTAAQDSVGELIEASTLSAEHAVDAVEPWVNGLDIGLPPTRIAASFHPNAAGMRAVADAIVAHVSDGG